ncbi:MAG: hypothetical protein WCS17_10975 [Prevotella sp.]
MEKKENCDTCSMRKKYDTNPKSLMGRFWRWHINFCPGWKNTLHHWTRKIGKPFSSNTI